MRTALKFLKHLPRGLKHLKGKGLEHKSLEQVMNPHEMKHERSIKPLKFKSKM